MGRLQTAKLALGIAKLINDEANNSEIYYKDRLVKGAVKIDRQDILLALNNISSNLSESYSQVKQDIHDLERKSWAGTAHEIREILANLLRELAPDDRVMTKPWFKKETESGRPSQKQRAIYILQERGANSTSVEVVQKVQLIDEMVGGLVRSTYSRASNAAHTYETKKEVIKLLRYFEAFAQDLLDL